MPSLLQSLFTKYGYIFSLVAITILESYNFSFAQVCTRSAINSQNYREIRKILCEKTWTEAQKNAKLTRGAANIQLQDTKEGIQGRTFLRKLNQLEIGETISPDSIVNIMSSKNSTLLRHGIRVGVIRATFEPDDIADWCKSNNKFINSLKTDSRSPVAAIEFALRCAE